VPRVKRTSQRADVRRDAGCSLTAASIDALGRRRLQSHRGAGHDRGV